MNLIKFQNGALNSLRENLLADLSKEAFAVLLAKREKIGGNEIFTVRDVRYPSKDEYVNQSITFLRMSEIFIINTLKELQNRYDVDSIIDVHTHPFAKAFVSFSGVDDRDEINFHRFLIDNFDFYYGSIVFSQTEYSARIWNNIEIKNNKKSRFESRASFAEIKTQLISENIKSSDFKGSDVFFDGEMFNRGVLALGLDNMRKIAGDTTISIVGSGGTGSVIAESLIHMGFQRINLIDNDYLEVSNMNRIVGAYYIDAVNKSYKVDVVSKHLKNINPKAKISSFRNDIHDKKVEEIIALSDWIIMATDNHSSRAKAQDLAFKYFVPFISIGVNITVRDGKIEDESGEIITVRMGDQVCLHCLKRLNHIKIAHERQSAGADISNQLEKKGYVDGKTVKEPAVKTLNSILGQLTVNTIVNQFVEKTKHQIITVFENNFVPSIYEDHESVANRRLLCGTCTL